MRAVAKRIPCWCWCTLAAWLSMRLAARRKHAQLCEQNTCTFSTTVLLRAAAQLHDLSGWHRVQQQCSEVSDCVRGEAVQRILTLFICTGYSPFLRTELKRGRFTVQSKPVPELWNLYRRWARRVFMRLLNDRLSRFLLREKWYQRLERNIYASCYLRVADLRGRSTAVGR